MLYGQHLHAEEQLPDCPICGQRAVAEVFYASGVSSGIFCLPCGRAKLARLQQLERLGTR